MDRGKHDEVMDESVKRSHHGSACPCIALNLGDEASPTLNVDTKDSQVRCLSHPTYTVIGSICPGWWDYRYNLLPHTSDFFVPW